ncbi:MAG: XRE family transcriptional regulator [Ruminiclostridium sp.]
MEEKTTDALLNEIQESKDLSVFLKDNDDEMICSTIAEELNSLLKEKKLKRAEVIRKSNLDTIYGNQIFSGIRKPKRDKLIAIAVGMGLDYKETQLLLKRTFFSMLYAKNKRDSVIIYCIQRKYDIFDLNIELEKNNMEILE